MAVKNLKGLALKRKERTVPAKVGSAAVAVKRAAKQVVKKGAPKIVADGSTDLPDIVFLPVDELLLDPDNPRLPENLQGGTQLQMLRYIAKSEAVEDLMAAIGRNGFFPGEPLVVYQHKGEKGYRVIEGNRRLASVRLLNDPSLYAIRKSLAEIANETPSKNKPKKLPVIKVSRREDALPYLGSRHIVGVKAWEPLPKARYMLQLFNSTDSSADPSARYRDVARQIGSGKRSDFVKKNLNALAVFNEIKSKDFYGDEDVDETSFSFGVLYTALDAKPIAGHAGVIKYNAETDSVEELYDPIVNPRKLNKAGIRDIYDWCFRKDEEGMTVLGESRSIPKFAAVLRSAPALKALRDTRDLEFAYERSGGISEEAMDALHNAFLGLKYVNSVLANAKIDITFQELAAKVYKQAAQIKKISGAKD